MSKKDLTFKQLDTLACCAILYVNERLNFLSSRPGWFTPMHHECAPVVIRTQTCKMFCGLGLLGYNTLFYTRVKGVYRPVNEYCITDLGMQTAKASFPNLRIWGLVEDWRRNGSLFLPTIQNEGVL
jgi:hypothetical protein